MKKNILIGGVLLLAILVILFFSQKNNSSEVTDISEVLTEESGDIAESIITDQDARELMKDISRSEDEQYIALTDSSFAHVAPGEYSEVYISVSRVEPGKNISVELSGAAVGEENVIEIVADSNGTATATFRVFQYGTYHSFIKIDGEEHTISQSVEVK